MLLLSSSMLLVAGDIPFACVHAIAGIPAVGDVSLVPDGLTVASPIAGITSGVVGVPAVDFVSAVVVILAVAGIPTVAGVFAVAGVLAVASVTTDPGFFASPF